MMGRYTIPGNKNSSPNPQISMLNWNKYEGLSDGIYT